MSELKESTLSAAQRLGQERKAEYAHATHAGDLRRLRKLRNFLHYWTGPEIEEKLSLYVSGQKELLQDVADFLRYHALRQLYPDLPLRPMLITGPSGCGRCGSLFLKKRNGIRNPIFRILLNKRKQASGK